MKSADEVVNYVNSQTTKSQYLSSERKADQISDLSAFSHGVPSFIRFGCENSGVDINKYDKSDFGMLEAGKFLKNAFLPNKSQVDLFSCNAATPIQNLRLDFRTEASLIQTSLKLPNLVNSLSVSTGATVTGYIGRTDYSSSGNGQLPSGGKTGGDYSPTVRGNPVPSIKVTSKNGKNKAN
ncbi:hypothetical protein [Pedobacter sp.]|uniref:hypothetical protein n=1 Tax=Pedobacter sp. TaxID=1411316 RepID=UPI0031DEFA71